MRMAGIRMLVKLLHIGLQRMCVPKNAIHSTIPADCRRAHHRRSQSATAAV